MTRRSAFLLLDSVLFAGFYAAMSWRFTGLPLHEWVGIGIAATVLFHLFLHWGWVESRVDNARRNGEGPRYSLVPLLLNVALFLAMGTVVVSGLVISKVVLPNRLSPGAYLTWHGIHETGTTLTLIVVGLHLALNWDRIRASLRHVFVASRGVGGGRWHGLGLSGAESLRRAGWVAVSAAALTVLVWGGGRLLPATAEIEIVFPDGHHERRAPPPEISALQSGADVPNPSFGSRRLVMSIVMLSLAGLIGRRVLKLRLTMIGKERSVLHGFRDRRPALRAIAPDAIPQTDRPRRS